MIKEYSELDDIICHDAPIYSLTFDFDSQSVKIGINVYDEEKDDDFSELYYIVCFYEVSKISIDTFGSLNFGYYITALDVELSMLENSKSIRIFAQNISSEPIELMFEFKNYVIGKDILKFEEIPEIIRVNK